MSSPSLDTSLGDILNETDIDGEDSEDEDHVGEIEFQEEWPDELQSSVIRSDLRHRVEAVVEIQRHYPDFHEQTGASILGRIGPGGLPHDLTPDDVHPYVTELLERYQERNVNA